MHAQKSYEFYGDGGIVSNLTDLRDRLLAYEFHVTERVGRRLWTLLDRWVQEAEEHEPEDTEWFAQRSLTEAEAKEVVASSGILRETLLAEAAGKGAFIAEDKRYTVSKLIGEVGSLMAPGVFDQLPEIAQEDFASAGRAIAYDLSTAAAFHILRGTESALREFYARIVRNNRIAEPRMWAAIVTDIRTRRTQPPKLLLDNLDSLRRNFRNPTQHPEKSYDADEVQDLLALAIDAVNRMIRHCESIGR